MKKLFILFVVATMLASLCACSSKKNDSLKVAIVKQLDHASLDEIASSIAYRLDEISDEHNITIDYTVYSGQNDQSVLGQIGSQVKADDVDLIIPIGTLATQMMTIASGDKIPVVFGAVSDPETAGLTDFDYVTGIADGLNTKQIMDMIFKLKPDVKKVGLLYSLSEINSKKAIEEAKTYLDKKEVDVIEATGNSSDEIKQAAASLIASGVDVVFTPTDNVVMACELAIAQDFLNAGVYHFTGADSFVRNGAFISSGVNYTKLGEMVADLAYQILTTGKIDTYQKMPNNIITINEEVCDKLDVDPSIFEEFGEIEMVNTSRD